MRRIGERLSKSAWLVALIAYTACLLAWAFASPVGSSPDEDFHLVSIWCADEGHTGLCQAGPSETERLVSKALVESACFAYNTEQSARCQNFQRDTHTVIVTSRGNFASNTPPLFYRFMSIFASDDIPVSVLIMRISNVAALSIIVGLTIGLLPDRRRIPTMLLFTAGTVPLGMFLIASLNPSAWAVTLVPVSFLTLRGALEEPRKPRRLGLLLMFMLSGVLAAGARADAAAYVLLGVVLAVVLTAKRTREYYVRNYTSFAAIGFICLAIVFFAFTSLQSSVISSGLPGLEDSGASAARGSLAGAVRLMAYNIAELPSLWAGSFGTWKLGWLDTPMPAGVWFASLFLVAAVVVVTLGFLSRREALAVALTSVAAAIVPIVILQLSAARVGQQVQPRYILPLVMLGLAIMLSSEIQWDRRSRIPISIGLIALVPAMTTAVTVNMVRYMYGYGNETSFASEYWWWGPWPPIAVVCVMTLAAAVQTGFLIAGLKKLDVARHTSPRGTTRTV